MPYIDRFVSVTEAKSRLLDLIRNLKTQKQIVAITRGGIPAAVLLSTDQYEELVESLEILSDRKAMASLKRSLGQARKKRWIPHQAVFDRSES